MSQFQRHSNRSPSSLDEYGHQEIQDQYQSQLRWSRQPELTTPPSAQFIPNVPFLNQDPYAQPAQGTPLGLLALAAEAPISLVKTEEFANHHSWSAAPGPARSSTVPVSYAISCVYQQQAQHPIQLPQHRDRERAPKPNSPQELYMQMPSVEVHTSPAHFATSSLPSPSSARSWSAASLPAISPPSPPTLANSPLTASFAPTTPLLPIPPSPTTTSSSGFVQFGQWCSSPVSSPPRSPPPCHSPLTHADDVAGIVTEFWGTPAPSTAPKTPPMVHVFRLRPGALEPVTEGVDGPVAPWLFDDGEGDEDEEMGSDEDLAARGTTSAPAGGVKRGRARRDKVYQCRECRKWFDRPSALGTHMNAHSGAQPFKCPVKGCGRHFSVRSNARRHARTHEAEIAAAMNASPEYVTPMLSSASPSPSPTQMHAEVYTTSGLDGVSWASTIPANTAGAYGASWAVPPSQWTSLSGALVPCA